MTKQQKCVIEAVEEFVKEFNPVDVLEAINSSILYADSSKLSTAQKERLAGNVRLVKQIAQAFS